MKKRGIKLQDGVFHEADHIAFSRRRFIKSFGLAGGMGLMLNNLPVRASTFSSWFAPPNLEFSDRVLVLVRLKGGNDGLNTIIPLNFLSQYHNYRPQLGYKDSEMIQLNGELAMSPHLSKLKPLWDEGMMKVVNGVGYPEQNYSHFRSADIWSSASDEDVQVNSGWVARYAEHIYPDYADNPPTDPPAIQLGGASSLLFTGEHNSKVGFEAFSGQQILDILANGGVNSLTDLPDCYYGDQLKYLRKLTNNTYRFVDRIKEAYNNSSSVVEYTPEDGFALSLSAVARLIKGGLKTKIYVVELDGFDTHANQLTQHPELLNRLGKSVSDFYADFKGTNFEDKVLTVTFSEFGRRVAENDGPGTDHGSASCMLAFGSCLKGNGSLGAYPSLTELDDYENFVFNTDFRRVYSTLMTEWLCLPDPEADQILFHDNGLPLTFGFDCVAIPTSVNQVNVDPYKHSATYSGGNIYISYSLPKATMTMIEIITASGKSILVERPANKTPGDYNVSISAREKGLTPGAYFYRIRVTGRDLQGKVMVY